MDSKRQSKLPEGLGTKIAKALREHNEGSSKPMQETGFNEYEELGSFNQDSQYSMDDHGLETISHMDFGAQEMQFDQQPLDSEFSELHTTSEVMNLDSATDSNGAQYGSFMENNTDDFSSPIGDAFSQNSFDQHDFETPVFQEDPFNSQQEDITTFEQVDYNQQSYNEFDYNQQSYDDFDFSQESYETDNKTFEPEAIAEDEEIASYQPPVLGESPAQQADHTFEQQYETPYHQDLESFSQTPEATQEEEFNFSTSNQIQDEQYQEVEPRIGYSSQDITENDPYNQQWQESYTPEVGLDLDSIEVQKTHGQYEEISKNPLDLDQLEHAQSTEPKRPEPQRFQTMAQQEERYTQYQEPSTMDERYYQQPTQDIYNNQEPFYGQEGQYYQDPHRNMYPQPQVDRLYQEPHRDMYHQPQPDRFYQDPHREIYHQPQSDRFYQDPHREIYHQPQSDRFYQDPHRDLSRNERTPMDIQRRPEHPVPVNDRYSSNVETLMRLVANLPNGVAKQTGAQIIRQTMEAMGISISEVIAEAQQTQGRMLSNAKENYTAIDEHKMQIRRLEDSIYMHQRKAKELDDIINLFIGQNQMRMHH